ncbi:MAG: hypothetical protein KKH41_00005 [Candidatus Thermoplasmatota archaeon]|nr:hypothetical protein [Euryarchaeota archaeon]MBU4032530.1 hypothetical protein [Candidatus Thermoplasmatota archaeon]MBU4072384.1 hypothetical protein [Candidatus Thermoplasmatota archaeon]MBU4145029.1 hypothetical protein [Candidatus Thermoplasmatota archaeon]MBU4590948.1 hypothetical protein [Candidatus Thermoplasmatota archaeon]
MDKGLDDDDEIFYGGGKPKPKKEEQDKKSEPKQSVYGSSYGTGQKQPEQRQASASPEPAQVPVTPEQERDIESEITATRHDKQMAAEIHDITKLRQKAAEHSAEAAKYFKKYRAEEAAMVKYTENASKARRTAEGYEEKSKDACAKADDKQADLEYLEDRKAERARMKIAKYKAKSAKMKSKASSYMAKSAKLSQKAAAKSQKSKAFLEQSKTHEAEAQNLTKRANKLQNTVA